MKAIVLAACAILATQSVPAAAEIAQLNGIDLHYTVRGTGEPLLLLHGFGSCAADWEGFAEKLSATHKVISVDARGHGKSTNPSGKFNHAQAAEDLLALLNHLEIGQARGIGFSSGGMTLLHLATRHPARVSKMVVIGATAQFPEQARKTMQAVTMDSLSPSTLDFYRRCASRGEEQVRSLVGQFRAIGFNPNDTNLGAADLAKIKAKTLIVHGDRDSYFPVSIPVAMYQSIGDSALWIVPKGGHSRTAGADEAVFIRQVESFLSK